MINSFIKLVRNIPHLFMSSETLQQNRSFLFKREEVEKLKGELEVEGITLYQASKAYHISRIEEGELACTIQEHRNRKTKFVKEDDIHELVQQIERKNTIYTYSQKHNVVLLQRFMKGNTLARIISIPKRGDIILRDEFGNDMTLGDAIKVGYEPAYVLSDQPRSHHQRFVKFRFPKFDQLRSEIFRFIDLILQYVSPRNLKISAEDEFWYFDIRQSLVSLPSGMQTEWMDSLTPYIIEGKLIQRVNNSVYLDSNTVTRPVTLTRNEYKSITKIVEETNSSIEEFIKDAIQDRINQHLLNQK
ncbi:DNA-binding protein [Bacillus pseudomycoides]|uniref:DNA-binding protein n=1 Tax=Bacillus pseudomycoides TaxID=64104 RepID=UPI00352ADEAC